MPRYSGAGDTWGNRLAELLPSESFQSAGGQRVYQQTNDILQLQRVIRVTDKMKKGDPLGLGGDSNFRSMLPFEDKTPVMGTVGRDS